ncbi:MAG TPA: NAD-dependent epimerase/dehydratase family protein [Thermoleophilaceae bacterium]|nr:NAD-dependent epimerase/dehydratase family protein [Thermoleophilaceae bacterium]
MRVVVVGATGNAGTSVLRALKADPGVGAVVGVARRLPVGHAGDGVEWRSADVRASELVPLFRGADAVVHLAWLIQPSRDLDELRSVNVDGSARVFEAVTAADVPALVYASSVGAYSEGPKDRLVDESWPTDGVPTSFYARHKAEVERLLDEFERKHPDTRVVRLRPGLIFKRGASSEIRRYFAGPFLPSPLLRPELIPLVPDLPRLRFQAVHSLDVGEAYRLAAVGDARGAFNIAADPVLDSRELGRLLDARPVRLPVSVLRAAADLTWRLRLQPTPPGWLDMALAVPLMDTARARSELGWSPRHSAGDALLELLAGMRESAGEDTPPLEPSAGGPARLRELFTGVGGRNP